MADIEGLSIDDDQSLDEPELSDEPVIADAPTETSELACEVCGEPLTYSGRGRKPKFCEVHKRSKSSTIVPDRNAGGSNKGRSFPGEASLRTALEARYFMLSGVLAMVNPNYALVVRAGVADVVDADIEYARVNPAFRRFLEGSVEKSAAAAVVIAHGKMFAPIIIGETAKRKMANAAATQARPQERGQAGPAAFPQTGSPSMFRRRPTAPQRPAPAPTDLYYPSEHEGHKDTVNAGAMPGMPG
jgi:hypothetical protein